MRYRLSLAKQLWLLTAPLVTSCAIASAPTLAATLSLSTAGLHLDRFSHLPEDVSTSIDTKTVALSPNGNVAAIANADAVFKTKLSDPYAYNFSWSSVLGEGGYTGMAYSIAQVSGYNFSIQAGETFSFQFTGFLALLTSFDSAQFEKTSATGRVSLQLYETTDNQNWKLLDLLTIAGLFTSSAKNDYFDYKPGLGFDTEEVFLDTFFARQQAFTLALIVGSFSQYFTSAAHLTLLEVKENEVNIEADPRAATLPASGSIYQRFPPNVFQRLDRVVSEHRAKNFFEEDAEPAPEPSSLLASLLLIIAGLGYKIRKKIKIWRVRFW